jgi:hypothetical protein
MDSSIAKNEKLDPLKLKSEILDSIQSLYKTYTSNKESGLNSDFILYGDLFSNLEKRYKISSDDMSDLSVLVPKLNQLSILQLNDMLTVKVSYNKKIFNFK